MTDPDDAATEVSGDAELDNDSTPERYEHDVARVPELAQLIDTACENASGCSAAGLRMEALANRADPPLPPLASTALFHTLMYVIKTAPVEDPADARLEPLEGPSLFPMALREAGDDLHHLWLDLAKQVRHPLAQARCWDIVFTLALVPNKRDAAERAVRAYLLMATTTVVSRADSADGLVRAWTMARLVTLSELTDEITSALKLLVAESLTARADALAVVVALSALAAPPRRGGTRTADIVVDELLDRALQTYSQINIIHDLAVLVRKRAGAGTTRAEQASRYEVNAMLAEAAAAADPIVIRTLYNNAAEAARRLGLTDLEEVAVAGLQSAPGVEWTSMEYTITTPKVLFDYCLPGLAAASDWRQALGIWLHSNPPTGSWKANEAGAKQAARTSVVHRIATVVTFRGGDLPARTIRGDEAIFNSELARIENQYMETYGLFLARALHQIRQRFGIPKREEVVNFLHDDLGTSTLFSMTLAISLELYWLGEYNASIHLITPKVEAGVRALLLELNEPLYRVAVGDVIGQFPGLGSLLQPLADNGFDSDWERFLRAFLLNDGKNIRNLVAHGYVHNTDPMMAALALRAGALVTLLVSQDAATRDAATVRATLAAPHVTPRNLRSRLAAAIHAALRELRR